MNTDPALPGEKAMIKEAVAKLEDDRDRYVKECASAARAEIDKLEQNQLWVPELIKKKKKLMQKELLITQINNELRRSIKTENEISKSISIKSTKMKFGEQRRTLNFSLVRSAHRPTIKDVASVGNIANTLPSSISNHSLKEPGSTLPGKKANLFRCHSLKLKGSSRKS
jgi:hypothetical protein